MSYKLVCLLSDFGPTDSYVSSMKGVILTSVPDVKFVDITHSIPPQNIRSGAFHLFTAYKSFPKNAFFIAVVDPGVGSKRKIIYAAAGGYHFIAPDNGLLSWVFEKDPPTLLFDVSSPPLDKKPSATFHGRDIMAPVASMILKGKPLPEIGKIIKSWTKLSFPPVNKVGSRWEGEILAVDGFGNLITNIKTDELSEMAEHAKPWIEMEGQQQTIRELSKSYSDVSVGSLLAIGGSSGFVEISIRNGSAAKKTGKKGGDPISVTFKG